MQGVIGFKNPEIYQNDGYFDDAELDIDGFVRNNIEYIPVLISKLPVPIDNTDSSSVLVFLPGVGEITTLRERLE